MSKTRAKQASGMGMGFGGDVDNIPFATGPRLAMWVWASDVKTQANIDTMLTWAKRRMTDLYVFAIDDTISPKTWLGTGTLGASSAVVVGGLTPWAYLVREAHKKGIRVHAWTWLTHFAYWGGTTGIDTSIPNNATYNDAAIWNFHDATAREAMIDRIVDFVTHNQMDGINLNLESTTANITAQDHTDFFTALEVAVHAVAPNVEISLDTGGKLVEQVTMKFDPAAWLSGGVVDTICAMGYYNAWQLVREYIDTLSATARHQLMGLGATANEVSGSDMRWRWKKTINAGQTDFAIFCWGSNLKNDADMRAAVDEYLAGTLNPAQAPITKISITAGTSFSLTVGGQVQTTSYADVTDHVYSAPLKQHIEAAIGSQNPEVIYYRANSTTTKIEGGDFEP